MESNSEKTIKSILKLLGNGVGKEQIAKKVKFDEELFGIAEARLRNEKIKKTSHEQIYMQPEDLRFATSDIVAEYRAKRLKCGILVEIGAGIGLQTIAFAKECKKVIAIEIDNRKCNYLKKNLDTLGISNVEVISDDAIEYASKIKKADIVFCETERSPNAEKRSIADTLPPVKDVLSAYDRLTSDICIEVPPQTREIQLDCEKEYVSVNGELNRLNLYFGSLKNCEVSAVSLPSEARLERKKETNKAKESMPLQYIYDIDTAVIKAGLIDELAAATNASRVKSNGELLTSDAEAKSPFLKGSFAVIARCNSKMEAVNELRHLGAGKVILRQKISPDDYWKERTSYEKQLSGKKQLYLFRIGDELFICRKVSDTKKD